MAKKCVFFLVLIAMLLSEYVSWVGTKTSWSMFATVERKLSYSVVYNKETRVMYAMSDGLYNPGTFTLLVNEDGTPMIWKEADDG